MMHPPAHMGTFNNPKWWSPEHQSAWDRIKAAFRRDWEQTKADVSDGGHELGQDVGDTVGQAAGTKPIPPGNLPNFDEIEPALRYGYAAHEHYGTTDWDDRVEGKLKEEWNDLKSGRTWDEVKRAVRRGWDKAKPTTRA